MSLQTPNVSKKVRQAVATPTVLVDDVIHNTCACSGYTDLAPIRCGLGKNTLSSIAVVVRVERKREK